METEILPFLAGSDCWESSLKHLHQVVNSSLVADTQSVGWVLGLSTTSCHCFGEGQRGVVRIHNTHTHAHTHRTLFLGSVTGQHHVIKRPKAWTMWYPVGVV